MIRRILSLLVLVWLLGFLWFAVLLPRPAGDDRSDAVVALTGSGGRIERGLDVLHRGLAPVMLVSGVDHEVKPGEFAAEYAIPPEQMACCISLGYESVDTRSNAREAARWITRHKVRTVRLVTSDWHMRRAALDLAQVAPPGLTVIEDAVPTRPSFYALFLEYHKLIARVAQRILGI